VAGACSDWAGSDAAPDRRHSFHNLPSHFHRHGLVSPYDAGHTSVSLDVETMLLVELLGSVFLLIWTVALLFLFFGRKRIFPSLMIFMWPICFFVLLDFVVAFTIPAIGS
jgi:hypothetical protein